MKVQELKEIIKDLPNEMMVGLIDSTTDDFVDRNYGLSKDDFGIDDYVEDESGDIEGKMLFIYFENKLNENPI